VSLEKQMNESARYVTQGQISRGVAHDFNNYLAGILGYTDLALRKAEEGSPGRQMLELIHENSLKTADFVKQLLQLSRKQGTPWGKVNIQELIEGLLPLFNHLIKSDIEINTSVEADLWPFEGDASQIEQIIINLFLNARDAISRGGQISLTITNHEVPSGRLPGGTPCRPGGYVHITLGDTGCGIAPEDLPRVFDPFYTTREPGRGPGLGLTRARRIMLDHSGYIEVESKPSQGSQFHLYFPGIDRIEESSESSLSGQSSRSLPLALLVEDEPIVLEMVTFLLENSGFEVISHEDPLEGIKLFQENCDKLSLVVSDMIMPNLTGDELVKRLREYKPEVNIILMSGYSDETIQSRLDGKTRFIQKPFSLETFTRVVKEVMGL
jgi:CheY-like chemotaxis protein